MRPTLLKISCLCTITLSFVVAGCAVGKLGPNLSMAIMNQDDPKTIRDGAPAFLLLLDGLIADAPEDTDLLSAGARLYGMYSVVFVENPERARRLADRARRYGQRALCSSNSNACNIDLMTFNEFTSMLTFLSPGDLPALYSFAVSRLIWLKLNSDDWMAIANLPKLEAALEYIIQEDETFEQGASHNYLGILQSRPAALGGKPDKARLHFERAIELSDGRNLAAKVDFARSYARLVYNRELHDRLLHEVLAEDPEAPGFTLMNVLAKGEARRLLNSADDYF